MTHARYVYLWWSGCQPKVKKHKVRSRGRMLVLIYSNWPKRVGQLGLWLSSMIGGAHPLGLRAPVAQHHIREVGATRNCSLWVSAHSPHLPAHRSGGAVSNGKLHRCRPPLRFTEDLHSTVQWRRTPSAPTRSFSTTYAPRWLSLPVSSSLSVNLKVPCFIYTVKVTTHRSTPRWIFGSKKKVFAFRSQ
jgi:hypothetical protein